MVAVTNWRACIEVSLAHDRISKLVRCLEYMEEYECQWSGSRADLLGLTCGAQAENHFTISFL